MTIESFVSQLLHDGRVVLEAATAPDNREIAAAVKLVREFESSYREILPHTPPALDHNALSWSITQFYQAAQQVAFKHLGVMANAGVDSPPPTAEACYSADLVFRFLPDLLRLCRGTEADEQVTDKIVQWAHEWPLSSVGIPLQRDVDIRGFIGHPCLRLLHVDRILSHRDLTRLNDERVAEAVRCALGAHSHLAPEVAAFLKEEESTHR